MQCILMYMKGIKELKKFFFFSLHVSEKKRKGRTAAKRAGLRDLGKASHTMFPRSREDQTLIL